MVKLSACVIAKNEEASIGQWIDNMKGLANEMIVVDTGSTDRTVEIAKAGGAKTYFYAWQDDFSAAKNFALSKASGDWILFLDADEYFSEESLPRVRKEIEKYDKMRQVEGLVSYLTNVDMDMDNRIISTAFQMRIFRNRKYLRFVSKIHEYIENLLKRGKMGRLFIDLNILHTGYTPRFMQDKLKRNLNMLQRQVDEKGIQAETYGYYIDCYFGLNEYEKTIECVEKYMSQEKPSEEQRTTVYRRWIDALLLAHRPEEECLKAIEIALGEFPDMPEFALDKARHFIRLNEPVQAEEWFRKAFSLNQTAEEKIEGKAVKKNAFLGLLPGAYYSFGKVLFTKCNLSETVEAYVQSLKSFRYHQIVLNDLYGLIRELPAVDIIALFNSIYEDSERDNKFLYNTLRGKRNAVSLYYEKRYKGKIMRQDAEHAMAAGKYDVAAEYIAGELEVLYSLLSKCAASDPGAEHKELEVLLPETYKNLPEASSEDSAKKISIVILSCNTMEITTSCIESIRQWTQDIPYEIVVVDNGSTDGSAAWLSSQPDVHCILNEKNEGFPKGCNQGTAAAKGTDVLFLNSDTVVTPRWLKQLQIALYSDEAIGAAGCMTNSSANFQEIKVPYGSSRQGLFDFAEKFNHSDPDKWERRLKLVGFCLLVKCAALERIGGFDEVFSPGNFEDDDLCLRLRQAGWKLILCKDTFIHHMGSASFRKSYGDMEFSGQQKEYYGLIAKNWQIFCEKWALRDTNMEGYRLRQRKEEDAYRVIEKKWGREHLPLVSVMIPTYNRPELFEQTLQSVRMQTYGNIEIIICDNSTDERTAELMQKYLADPRLQYHRNREAKTKAENFAPFEQLAKGEFLQWLMDDDLLEPDKTTRMLAAFAENEQVKLVTSNRRWIDADGRDIGNPVVMQAQENDSDYAVISGRQMGLLMLHDSVNYIGEPSAVLFRRADLQHHYWQAECRGYRVISDVVMWLELLESGDCAYFKQPLSSYRRHDGQEGQSAEVVLQSRIEWFRIIAESYQADKFFAAAEEFKEALEKLIRDADIIFGSEFFQVHPEIKESKEWQEYQEILQAAADLTASL